jgi:hypothetical protein
MGCLPTAQIRTFRTVRGKSAASALPGVLPAVVPRAWRNVQPGSWREVPLVSPTTSPGPGRGTGGKRHLLARCCQVVKRACPGVYPQTACTVRQCHPAPPLRVVRQHESALQASLGSSLAAGCRWGRGHQCRAAAAAIDAAVPSPTVQMLSAAAHCSTSPRRRTGSWLVHYPIPVSGWFSQQPLCPTT